MWLNFEFLKNSECHIHYLLPIDFFNNSKKCLTMTVNPFQITVN